MFPPKRSYQILVPIVALILGFVVNGVRVALMTVLAASDKLEAFEYWHTREGSLFFGMIAIAIFGLFYAFLLRQDESENQENEESIRQ